MHMFKIFLYIIAFIQTNGPSEAQKCRQIKAEFDAKVRGLPLNTSIAEFKECYNNCTEHPDCQTMNFQYTGTRECNLMSYNVHENPTIVMPKQEWMFIENKYHPCNLFPNRCVTGFCERDPHKYLTYNCVCPDEKTSGKECELPWVRLASGTVCLGDTFSVMAKAKGRVFAFKLVRSSGVMNCGVNKLSGYWGCKDPNDGTGVFKIELKNNTNDKVLAPLYSKQYYSPKVKNRNLVFRVEDKGIVMGSNEEFKLVGSGSGATCARIYAAFQ